MARTHDCVPPRVSAWRRGGRRAALLAACTSNETPNTAQTMRGDGGNPNAAPGKAVTIGFSAPAADHGWIAAITNNAKAQAAAYSDVSFKPVEAGKDAAAQRAALATLIAQKPDVIVLLPHDGKELNAFGLEAMEAGIPVVNLDRAFPDPAAYRLQIKGDNYGMGVAAGQLHRRAAQGQGRRQPDHRRDRRHRLPGADPGAVEGLRGRAARRRLQGRQPAGGRVHRRLRPAGGGAPAAGAAEDGRALEPRRRPGHRRAGRDQPGQPQRVLHGRRRRSLKAIQDIQADNTVLKATVTYSPSMASSAISLARLIAQGRGMSDLVELQVPKEIILASETITKENASQLPASSASKTTGEYRTMSTRDSGQLRVGMVGYAFMGAAHSQAWRTVNRVFDLPLRARMVAVCGRDADRGGRRGRPARLGGGRHRLARRWSPGTTST